MKYINTKLNTAIVLVLIMLFTLVTNAQDKESFTVPISNPDMPGKLQVHVLYGSINVVGYDGTEVIVTATGSSDESHWKHKKKSKGGMKRLDDNSFSFTVEEVNNMVYVKSGSRPTKMNLEIKVPYQFSVDLKAVNKGNIYVENTIGTHEVSNTNGKITMVNVSGSVIADALNKDVVISFKEIHENATMMFSSLNGDIDITFPSSLKANVNARSDFGDVFTDFDIEVDQSKKVTKTSTKNGVYKVKREKGVYGTINGGGADMTFKTLNGDVLIRSN